MLRLGTLVLPTGSTEAPIEEVTIASSGIASLFAQYGVDRVAKAFPDFQLADTLGIARTGEVVHLVDRSLIWTLVLAEGGDAGGLSIALAQEDGVVYAEPNGGVELSAVFPNDPKFQDGTQWNLHNTGQNEGTSDAVIDAPEAWEITRGDTTTRIGIIDTGLSNAHPDLAGKVTGDLDSPGGHGLFVGGVAAANTNNELGIAGVDWNARINSQDLATATSDADMDAVCSQALYDGLAAACQITNHSYVLVAVGIGIPPYTPRYSTTVRVTFSDAYKLNTVTVAAMGNNNATTTYWPAAFGQGVIAVGATDRRDRRWVTDPAQGSNMGAHLDVTAPGADIVSASPGGTYAANSGTSAAAPHVAGLAGLMLAVDPLLYNDDIEQIIRRTTDDLGGPEVEYGTGRINTRRALERLLMPYVLRRFTSEPGGTIVNSSEPYPLTMIGASGIGVPALNGQYSVRRHEVQKAVTFSIPAPLQLPEVWGRGVATTGYSIEESDCQGTPCANFGMGWCEVVDGTLTNTGCTFRTFVYEVWDGAEFIGWYPSTAGNTVFAYTVLSIDLSPPGGGCPFVDTRTASGWREENSILGRSLNGSLALDPYRLKVAPEVRDGRILLRIRENEQEYTTLDQVRLVAVDHEPGQLAYAVGDRVHLGARIPAYRVTTASGENITALVNGTGGYHWGRPGDTLLVEMTSPRPSGIFGASAALDGGGGEGSLEGDPKETEIAQEAVSEDPAPTLTAGAVDASVLASTGILVEVPDGAGGWRTLTHYYPRRYRDETVVDSLGRGRCRLIFLGRHRLQFIGRYVRAEEPASPQALTLLAARHSRLGDTRAAVGQSGGATAALAPGDTVTLEFAPLAVPPGLVRDYFLLSTGVYSSTAPLAQGSEAQERTAGLPARFALAQNQPNPFVQSTTIRFELPVPTPVRLEVFDLQGRRVVVLAQAPFPAGYHAVEWDRQDGIGKRVRLGVYLYRIEAASFRTQRKMVILP